MNDRHPVSISSSDGFSARLAVGGHDISAVTTAVRLDLDTRNEHRLTLTLRAFPLSAGLADAHVALEPETHDLLVRLGWTPPGGEIPCR